MNTLKFGIIGIGSIAPIHVAAIKSTPNMELAAVATRNKEHGESFVSKHGGKWYDDYHQLLESDDVDVISICTPHHMHAQMTIDAAEAGKHVLCEKPMAINVNECDKMINACKKANVTLGVIFQCRFEPLSLQLKAAFNESRLGRLLLASANTLWFRDEEYYSNSTWRGKKSYEGGGVFINQAIHAIDLLLWLTGMPDRVTAKTRTLNHKIEVEDCGLAILEYAKGYLGLIQATTCAYHGYPERLEFYGARGSVIYHKGQGKLEWHLIDPSEDRIDEAVSNCNAANSLSFNVNPMIAEYQDFASAIRKGHHPLIDGYEGRRSIELIEAIYRSAYEDKTIEL
jgi:predicted dehydrogenase